MAFLTFRAMGETTGTIPGLHKRRLHRAGDREMLKTLIIPGTLHLRGRGENDFFPWIMSPLANASTGKGWETQTFTGNLTLLPGEDGHLTAINELPLEEYLVSVVSSEMNGESPHEFLKAHAIASRSWLAAMLASLGQGRHIVR